jgi:hypothetical protein
LDNPGFSSNFASGLIDLGMEEFVKETGKTMNNPAGKAHINKLCTILFNSPLLRIDKNITRHY